MAYEQLPTRWPRDRTKTEAARGRFHTPEWIFLTLFLALSLWTAAPASKAAVLNINGTSFINDFDDIEVRKLVNEPEQFLLTIGIRGPLTISESGVVTIAGNWIGGFTLSIFENIPGGQNIFVGGPHPGSPNDNRGWLQHDVHPHPEDEPPTSPFLFFANTHASTTSDGTDQFVDVFPTDLQVAAFPALANFPHPTSHWDVFDIRGSRTFIAEDQRRFRDWEFTLEAHHVVPLPLPALLLLTALAALGLLGSRRRH